MDFTNTMASSDAPHVRYRHKPFVGSSHTWALAQCGEVAPGARVLDIGCGSGVIGRELKERGFSDIHAVEVDAEARQNAASIYQSVGSSLADYESQRFDLVLLLDVIEHLTNPEAFLSEAAALLKPAGLLLVSVPNVAHWSVRLPLLFGFFEYTQRGILDRTHFQFFTRRRFRQILRSVPGTETLTLAASISPAEFIFPPALWNTWPLRAFGRIRNTGAQFWPGLLAYQHLAKVRKKI